MNVIKRDGASVAFNGDKIRKAIKKAADSINVEVNQNIIDVFVTTIAESKEDLKVEDIQDLVVKYLMDFPEYKNLVLAYERYRTIRTKDRNINRMFTSIQEIIEVGSDENANKESKKGNVKRDLAAGEIARYKAENELLPPRLVEAHRNKKIHIHDIDFTLSPMTNCCVVNITDMLKNGTVINNAQICSPKSIEVASNVTAQIVAEVAHSQYGGISIHAVNEIWSPYCKMTFAKNFLKFFAADYMDLATIEKIDSYHNYLNANFMDMNSEDIAKFEAKLSHIYNEALGIMATNFGINMSREDICYHNSTLSIRFRKTWLMAKMETEKNIFDACQSYEYQMNTLSSAS